MSRKSRFSRMLAMLLCLMLVIASVPVTVAETAGESIVVTASEQPTAEPTEEPAVEPTEEPAVEPTEEPTVEPTEEPTVEPTEEPTVEPTEEPAAEPEDSDFIIENGELMQYTGTDPHIVLPAEITAINEDFFNNLDEVLSYTIAESNECYSTIDGVLFEKDEATLIRYPKSNAATAYTVPASVERIEASAFADCLNLKQVVLPDGLDAASSEEEPGLNFIGVGAFADCEALEDITIPRCVTGIGMDAFLNCTNLVIRVYRTSYAHDYCDAFAGEQGFAYELIDPAPAPVELAAPVMGAHTVVSSLKLIIRWGEVEGADGYQIWRSDAAKGNYEEIGITTRLEYVDSDCLFGKINYYKVRAYAEVDGETVYGPLSVYRSSFGLATPGIQKLEKVDEGVKVTAATVANATGYYIYRCEIVNGLYDRLGTTTLADGVNTFIDTTAELGKTYYYKCRAYHIAYQDVPEGVTYVGPFSVGKSITVMDTLPRPSMGPATVISSTELKITWEAVPGATMYDLYRSDAYDGTYTKITSTTALSYNDTACLFGRVNYYKVQARSATAISEMSIYRSCFGMATSGIKAVSSAHNPTTLTITFGTVANASGYYVLRSLKQDEAFVRVGVVDQATPTGGSTLTFVDTTVSTNVTYYYKMQAYHDNPINGTRYLSPFSVVRAVNIAPPAPTTNYRALLIGNTYPDSNSPLYGPENDARSMANMMSYMFGTPYYSVRYTNEMYDDMMSDIDRSLGQATENDVSLFYFSGHGTEDGQLVTADFYGVSPNTLRNKLDEIPGKKIVIIDCCYSGKMIGKSFSGNLVTDAAGAERFTDNFIDAFSRQNRANLAADGYYVITACSGRQVSWEASFGDYGSHGIFTVALTQGCGWDSIYGERCDLEADTNGDGALTLHEVYTYTKELTSAIAEEWDEVQSVQVYPTNCSEVIFASHR